jgi:hypothetical protein
LLALLPPAGRGSGAAVADLALAAGDFAPVSPRQESFWPTRDQRQGVLDALGQALARRSGRPLLLQARAAAPEAIFAEDRYRLVPAGPGGAPGARPPSPAGGSSDVRGPEVRERAPLRLHWWS